LYTISLDVKDPQTAKKIARALEALARGESLERAAAYASLEKRVLVRFLEAIQSKAGEAAARTGAERVLEWTEIPAPRTPEMPGPRTTEKPGRQPAERLEKAPRKTTKKTAGKATGLKLVAYSDGASRGNPGKAACAVIILDGKDEELLRRSKSLGRTTNNVAEYEGVLYALELAELLGASELELRLDSELVVRQVNGQYKVKHPSLQPLFERTRARIKKFERVTVKHIPRAENKKADELANAELDGRADDVI
jgi:ribonuclease HI